MDDIVDRLLHMAWLADEGEPYADALLEAADEIQRLRAALALACNELFGTCDPLKTSPHELMTHFLEEARDG
jgi:hypothetical protein